MRKLVRNVGATAALLCAGQLMAQQPDLRTLKRSGFIMGPGSSSYQIDPRWKVETSFMKNVDIFDETVKKIQQVVCSDEPNKGVLLIGEPTTTYTYILARAATTPLLSSCKNMWFSEIDINKIEAGHQYRGQTEEYWADNVMKPALQKDAVLFFRNLANLIGIGTHSGQDTGVEADYVANIESGKLRTIGFMDKFAYNYYRQSRHSYVLNSYAEKIKVEPITTAQTNVMVQAYLATQAPKIKLSAAVASYLYEQVAYYQPNIGEPQRSLAVMKNIVRKVGDVSGESHDVTFDEARLGLLEFINMPQWIIDQDFSIIRDLGKNLDLEVVGVAEGKKDLIRLAKIGYAVGRTDEKPIASTLFVGPTGTGKSYIAKKMAQAMDMQLITLDMTAYKDPDTFDDFLQVMTNYLSLYPYAFYLFEEIDKANYEVLDRLYFMMDEGIFYDRLQRPLFARGAFIMMTTNTAKNTIITHQDDPELRDRVNKELQKHFRPSFLNRFDSMSIFKPFSDSEFVELAQIMSAKKVAKLKQRHDWNLKIQDEVVDYLAVAGRSALYGARPMERTVENVIAYGLAIYTIDIGVIERGAELKLELVDLEKRLFRLSVLDGSAIEFTADAANNDGKSLNKVFQGFLQDLR